MKDIKEIKRLKPSEIRKLPKAELEAIVPLLRAEEQRVKNGLDWFAVSNLYTAAYNSLEKYAKEERKALRESKKNSKEIERKRIEGLASTLRKNLIPVENALSESIIKYDNDRLERQDKFFKSLPSPYLFRLVSQPSSKSDEIEYSEFSQTYRRFWLSETQENDYRPHAPKKAVKKDNVSQIIVKDAKDYAKQACDSFACKIVQKTEEEIASRKSSEKIVSTTYKGNINPWDGAKVIVKTDKGEYVWNTKVILNFSKYGLPFNQWPTRLAE
ncbi:MAG: hypothetical protein EBT82_02440 [Micrococcales bacterium]|nr:hypothetical protein [Micrococcales bacterium]NBR54825.1 hypothetical protein [Micrococcales bacterium]